jgi:haloalkane dehalogenase
MIVDMQVMRASFSTPENARAWTMDVLRTPDARFAGLPDFPFAPHYREIANGGGPPLRIHYLDEGPQTAAPVLLLHGEPSWCYLYRHMIPPLAARGHRVLAPDLVGFGKSDKPAARNDYTFERHVDWMSEWLLALDLRDITLFCQDWGGLIGLRLVARFPERFARVVAGNTGLPSGGGKAPLPFKLWVAFSQWVPRFPVGWLVSKGTVRGLTGPEQAAYDAPFPDERYKAGVRQFPLLVPITDAHASVAECRQAWEVLSRFDKPFLTAFSDRDPITRGGARIFRERIPGAKGQPHTTIRRAGHFLQEDQPAELVELIDRMATASKSIA